MPLKTIIESLDGVEEKYHDLYEEKDGKFVARIDGVDDHPTVAALRNSYRNSKSERDAARQELAALKDRFDGLPDDFDAAAYEALKQQAEGKEPPKTDEQVTRVRDQLERKHQADLAKKDERIAALETSLRKSAIDDGLSEALDAANIDPLHKKKLIPYLKDIGNIKIEEADGKFAAVVETDMGRWTLSQFVTDWASTDDGKPYLGKAPPMDAPGSQARGSGEKNPWASDSFNLTRQGDLIRADPNKARSFMRSAGLSDAQISQRIGA